MTGIAARALEDRAELGMAMMLVAYLVFAFIDTSVKWLVLAGLPAVQLAFMRYAGAFAISAVQIVWGGARWERFATDHLGLVLVRGALLISATVLNFIALKYLTLTVTSAIMFSAPIILCALSMPLLGERVGPWRWAAILLGFVGVMVVIRPFGETFHWAALLCVYNASALALYSILTRRLAGVVATETMQIYMGGLGTLTLLPFAVWVWTAPATGLDWGLMVALGIWGWGGHELLTRAHAFAPANTLMPFTYSFMIYLTVAGYLVFADLPDGWTLLGAGIIVVSGLIIWMRERQRGVGAQR
ncbi:DMT family transporter [Actibacterium sp. 188UL27-1]|uniref:DMT family transporter n=1 Tax=Actibacterium sp. 188UL27-1 TaxID=2786961 RepID=UPI0019576B8D|nr:DMT family transporter [Actibacterium sp. 188UL27-1]MBM7066839.1 DMT family transporter [Actibacterium sp. 188UL27-1]